MRRETRGSIDGSAAGSTLADQLPDGTRMKCGFSAGVRRQGGTRLSSPVLVGTAVAARGRLDIPQSRQPLRPQRDPCQAPRAGRDADRGLSSVWIGSARSPQKRPDAQLRHHHPDQAPGEAFLDPVTFAKNQKIRNFDYRHWGRGRSCSVQSRATPHD